jgi:hypothetical protein
LCVICGSMAILTMFILLIHEPWRSSISVISFCSL